jgi:predicted RNA-binding protein
MCLSTVYYADDVKRSSPLARNVTSVSIEGDKVVLIDLLGEQSMIPGIVERIDLIKNFITIKSPKAVS